MSHRPSYSVNTIPVYCGELCSSDVCNSGILNLLNYDHDAFSANITIGLEKFVKSPNELPSRIADLLHIAAYVYCADRLISRGERDSLSNHAWARSFEFHIPVVDYDFWSKSQVSDTLCEVLTFMTGDRKYTFIFSKATLNPIEKENEQLSLFTKEYSTIQEAEKTDVMLFSGGLDSLAGAIERLNVYSDRNLCLVSHKSNPSTIHTQNQIVKHLQNRYDNRCIQYGFECHNRKGAPSRDETQRTRMFLFASIAFAICNCYHKKEFFVFENGITSINLSKQTDVINARASRTTHPKTIGLLRKLFKLFASDFDIKVPYYNKTKADILEVFKLYNEQSIIASSVSCSSTRNKPKTEATHCGCCSQCIDRIFAMYSSGLDEYDVTYADDFIYHIPNEEVKQRLYNTVRLAIVESDEYTFFENHPDELMDVLEYWPADNPNVGISEIYQLFCRFGHSVTEALKNIQFKFDNLVAPYSDDSLLRMIAQRQYLKSPIAIKVDEIDALLRRTLPMTFKREQPKGENDFNDKLQGLLNVKDAFSREYPSLQFAETVYKADHAKDGLLIESKYLRSGTTPSTASEGIAADITKIPNDVAGILFVVYDPYRSITDDEQFINAFQAKRDNCFVRIYR